MNFRPCFHVVAYAALCGLAASVSAAPLEWPAYQGNVEHSGYVPGILPTISANPRPVWQMQVQATRVSGLAVTDGVVLTTPDTFFSGATPIVAQSVDDGHTIWSHDFGQIFSVNQPATANGVVYIQSSNNEGATFLHAYRIDGSFLWRVPFDSQWEHYLGPIVVDDHIYFDGGQFGGMYGMNTDDGSQIFYTNLPQYDSWSPTWHDGTLIAFTDRLDVVAAATGQVITTIVDPDYYWSGYSPNEAPVVVGDFAYVTNGGRLIAFDLVNEDIAWQRDISATGQVTTDGTQLFVVAGGALSVRDPANGDLLWAWVPSTSGSVTTRIVVTDSHVILGDETSTYLVNRETHAVDSTLAATGMIAYAEDTIFIADDTGTVSAYRADDLIFASGFE